jgi:hypothetical protein
MQSLRRLLSVSTPAGQHFIWKTFFPCPSATRCAERRNWAGRGICNPSEKAPLSWIAPRTVESGLQLQAEQPAFDCISSSRSIQRRSSVSLRSRQGNEMSIIAQAASPGVLMRACRAPSVCRSILPLPGRFESFSGKFLLPRRTQSQPFLPSFYLARSLPCHCRCHPVPPATESQPTQRDRRCCAE